MKSELLPLLRHHDSDAPFIWRQGQAISRARFLAQARQLAARLPEAGAAINLCEDRYHFLLAFVALALRGQVNLLPPDRAPHTLAMLAEAHPGSYALVDAPLAGMAFVQLTVSPDTLPSISDAPSAPLIPADQTVATVFTSGSTGHSQPNHKSWAELYQGAMLNLAALGLHEADGTLLATVPAQHMYGLELSVLLPLLSGLAVEAGRPFFPADLQHALSILPEPRWLISTPLHLRSCLRAEMVWPPLAGIVSATAPLDPDLATQLEQWFGCPLHEIYGSSETGAIATRRTAEGQAWQLHAGLVLQADGDAAWRVSGGHLAAPVRLNDRLAQTPDGCFRLLGRERDLIKIAGKRASLADLNRQLLAVPGVVDGSFVPPEEAEPSRLQAVVVAPGMTARAVLDALQLRIDAAFLPRPLHLVEKLPRNPTGKLHREVLCGFIASLK
ncbi:MAG: acyl-CoA synthetase [Gammaproteobacteria bacterium]|nr:acyl-CoA synthetase [Gammaproteobacteria bacterium]